ncbi:hypothetical protein HNQ07_002483 [Deinococcus metalli]|uniref:Uncharacterized protein n=1 Tax=Deinococcus metalli TaxID=1141878 RepID=A0A7W8KF30_9DEIO|nr:hypothetical protein [Deinococcus metalli]
MPGITPAFPHRVPVPGRHVRAVRPVAGVP